MPRVVPASIAVLSVLLVAGCGSPTTTRSGDPAGGTGTNRGTSVTSAAPSATPTPGTVPVDQVPPGRPASWIPAGVTTNAPWQEPGDFVPRFTPVMFDNTPAGAFAMARYHVVALNWMAATLDPTAFLLGCESAHCKESAEMIRGYLMMRQHISGARDGAMDMNLLVPGKGSGAQWVVRTHMVIAAGALVDSSGAVLKRQARLTQVRDLYMRWSGKRWLVHEDALAPEGTK